MSSYKLTGYHSHRHPLLGDGDVFEALAADAAPETTASKLTRPLLGGAVTGLIAYTTCRTFDVDAKKARQVAFVLAGVNILVGLASDWIYKEMLQLATPATAVSEVQS